MHASLHPPELLAPAGSYAIAEAAFEYGADAVYAGLGQANLRAHAPSFTPEELSALLALAAAQQKKVYITLNCMPDDEALAGIEAALVGLAALRRRPDAIIVSDPGALHLCRTLLPGVTLHLSTQTGVFNTLAARFWKEQGIRRIILPRELTLPQVRAIAESGVETELFIHGAMCVSVSGRCLLGAYLDGRHPNKGDCTQPCRLRYRIEPLLPEGTPADHWFEAEESDRGVFLLNAKDLCALPILHQVIATGVRALKIEGRNKSLHYVATTVRVYRQAIDAWCADPAGFFVRTEWLNELDAIEHRPYTTGFYGGEEPMQAVFVPKSRHGATMAGVVKATLADGAPVIDVRSVFRPGDRLQVLPINRRQPCYTSVIQSIEDLAGDPLGYAPLNRIVVVRGLGTVHAGDVLRIVTAESAATNE